MSNEAVPVIIPETHFFKPTIVQATLTLAALEAVRDNYTAHFRPFVAFVQAKGEEGNPLKYIPEYIVELNARSDLSASTKRIRRQAVKRRAIQALRLVDRHTRQDGEQALKDLDTDPLTRAPKIQTEAVGQDKVIEKPEFEMLIAGSSKRTALVMRALYQTGMRIAELTGIRLADLEDQGAVWKVRITGKGRKERHIFLDAALVSEVRETFAGGMYLFETSGGKRFEETYLSFEIAKAGRRILNRRISAHTFRHSWASLKLRMSPADLPAWSSYLGHSSTAITLSMYCHPKVKAADYLAGMV